MKNCANCGQVNHDTQMQCGRCGAFLNAPNFAPNPQQGFNQFGYNPPPIKKKSPIAKILLLTGGGFVLMCLVIAGVMMLMITRTTRWKIQETWRLDSATMNGVSAPLGAAQGTTVKFNENMSFVSTLPNGTSENGTYRIINEQSISTTDRSNTTMTYNITFDGDKLTMVSSTRNNMNISLTYSKTR